VRQCPYAQVIPIIGARTVKQLNDNLACLEWTLTEEQMNRLNAATGFVRGYPEDLLIDTRPYLFGKSYDLLGNHRSGPYETKA
jgi:hypothetical protein